MESSGLAKSLFAPPVPVTGVIGGGALFDLATKAVTYARPGYLMREGVREDLQAIYDRIESGAPAEVSV